MTVRFGVAGRNFYLAGPFIWVREILRRGGSESSGAHRLSSANLEDANAANSKHIGTTYPEEKTEDIL